MTVLTGGDPVLLALRGTARVKPYDSRAITRSTGHPTCNLLPVAASMGVEIDTIAAHAYEAGLGPEPRRTMSQLARQQGETFDANVLTDGNAALASFHADGWLAETSIRVINVDDHVNPPRSSALTGDGGKPGEQAWRQYHRDRARYTEKVHREALDAADPTLLMRGVVETTRYSGGTIRTFGEFDLALVYPRGTRAVSDEINTALGTSGDHDGVTVLGDAKSWRKLARLDNGEKRAGVAVQVGLYRASAEATWPAAQASTLSLTGIVINPPATGGLATTRLTRIDLADSRRALEAGVTRHAATTTAAAALLADAVTAGARLDLDDTVATRDAVTALMQLSDWNPSCLSSCPMGQACRRNTIATSSLARLGDAASAASSAGSLARLHELRSGATPTIGERDLAVQLTRSQALLGDDEAPSWDATA